MAFPYDAADLSYYGIDSTAASGEPEAMPTSHHSPGEVAAGPGSGRVKRQRSNREFGLYAPTTRAARHPRPQGPQVKHDAGTASGALHHDHIDHDGGFDCFEDESDPSFEYSSSQLSFSDPPIRQDFSYKSSLPSPVSPRWDSLANNTSAVIYDPAGAARNPHRIAATAVSPTSPAGHLTSGFPALTSNPYLADPPVRAFPLSNRSQEDAQRRALTPSSPTSSPSIGAIDSRPSTATDANMVENFSRPRKPSIKYQPQDVPIFQPSYSRTNSGLELDHSFPAQPPPATTPQLSLWPRARGMSGSSAQSTSTFSSLPHRPSNDHLNGAYRAGSLRRGNPTISNTSVPLARPPLVAYNSHPHTREAPWMGGGEELRSSVRSQLTASTAQGTLFTASGTERSSVLTKASSMTEGSIINSYNRTSTRTNSAVEGGLSVEDVMGMYENGFESDFDDNGYPSIRLGDEDNDTHEIDIGMNAYHNGASRPGSSHSSRMGAKLLEAMSDQLPAPGGLAIPGAEARIARNSAAMFRRSMLPNSLPKDLELGAEKDKLIGREKDLQSYDKAKHDSAKLVNEEDLMVVRARTQSRTPSPDTSSTSHAPAPVQATPNLPQEPPEDPGSRDRYGFRKANAYITREQYDTWDSTYTEYLARRRKKWVAFLKDSSLMTENPNRFPPRNAKTKRFIRKGIPPEWRGAAWFYYARGPAILAKHPGTYDDLVRRAGLEPKGSGSIPGVQSEQKSLVVEDIEKDLHRTFPDNVHFKPPQRARTSTPEDSQETLTDNSTDDLAEPTIISSLRRVLHAFALYNPRIGYCQSLNFLAGMLLLFVETEEQAFWLLNVITRVYLPGTHEMSLEGSKVDLGVLMIALKESMPAVWKHLAGDEAETSGLNGKKGKKRGKDSKQGSGANDPDRLPAITLCMTAWFMSCFIGTLPIETVLRVWDIFFYEGSRTLFRIALAVFKVGEAEIKAVGDPMEMFGVVQAIPRRLLDPNALLETCYKRRNGIGHLSQEVVEERRQERRDGIRKWKADQDAANDPTLAAPKPTAAGLDLAAPNMGDPEVEIRRKGTLFGRKRDREQVRAAEVM